MNLYVLKCFEYKSALLRVAYSGGKEGSQLKKALGFRALSRKGED